MADKTSAPLPENVFDLEVMAAALLRHRGIESGLWRLAVRLHFAGSTSPWTDPKDNAVSNYPTGLVGFAGAALIESTEPGPLIFDAALLRAKFPAKVVLPLVKRATRQRKVAG